MSTAQLEHPPGAILVAYGLGELGEFDVAELDGHLASCGECRQVVEGVVPDTLMTMLRSAATDPEHLPIKDASENQPASPAPAPLAELAAHPRYRVVELLGVGGMGAVYRAEHLFMERPVALKVLNRKLTDKPATVERFRREVRAAARLTHPNIVAAFDAEQAGDIHFLAMEFVEGVSLARRCAERGPLPAAEACEYIRQAALGLQHAHERGMVHRDIKPQNLMLTPGGQVKILDFGLSRFVVESAPADTSLSMEPDPTAAAGQEMSAIRLTHTGLVMGTPDYIAPEQARDSHIADIRADIYSLGCTLYELLAGQAPFPEGNAIHKVKGHLSRTPQSLESLRRDVPLELVHIVDRMMAKDPANRFQTPAEVAAATAPFVSAAPRPPRRKTWIALAACAAVLAAVLAGTIIYVQTDNGRIVIETNDDTIAVMIHKPGGVKIVDQSNKREYILKPGEQIVPSGEYLLDVSESMAGLDFQTKKFELKRGQEVRLTAKFQAVLAEGKGAEAKVNLPKAAKANPEMPSVEIFDETHTYKCVYVKASEAQAFLDRLGFEGGWNTYRADDRTNTLFVIGSPAFFARVKNILMELDQPAFFGQKPLALSTAEAKTEPGGKGLFQGKPARYWTNQFEDADPKLRPAAVVALGNLARKDGSLIPTLAKGITDHRDDVALNAAIELRFFGPPAILSILEVLRKEKSSAAVHRMMDMNLEPPAQGGVGANGVVLLIPTLAQSLQKDPEGTALIPILVQSLVKDGEPAAEFSEQLLMNAANAELKSALPAMIVRFGMRADDVIAAIKKDKENNTVAPRQQRFGQAQALLESLARIDLDLGPILAGIDFEDPDEKIFAIWRDDYELLRKRYPLQPTIEPASPRLNKTANDVPAGAMYLGKPASFWLNQLQDSAPQYRLEAVIALASLAEKNKSVFPKLVDAIKDKDSKVAAAAVRALGRNAGKDNEAVTVLVGTLTANDINVAEAAATELVSLGPEVLPVLLERFDRRSPAALKHAAFIARSFGRKSAAAAPMLNDALKMEDQEVRFAAMQTLTEIGPSAKVALPTLVDLLGRSLESKELVEWMDRGGAPARGPGPKKIGPDGKQIEGHAYILWSSMPYLILEALLMIDPEIKGVLPDGMLNPNATPNGMFGGFMDGRSISRIYFNAPTKIWKQSYENLQKRYPIQQPNGPPAKEPKTGAPVEKTRVSEAKDDGPLYLGKPASYWQTQLQDSAPKARLEAVEALGVFAEKNKDLAPMLVTALEDKDSKVAEKAAKILQTFGPDIVPMLLDRVNRKSPTALKHAADVVGAFGSKASVAVPMLIQTLKADSWNAKSSTSAMRALGNIGPDAKPALSSFVDLLGVALESKEVIAGLESRDADKNDFGPRKPPIQPLDRLLGNSPSMIVGPMLSIDPEIKNVLPDKLQRENFPGKPRLSALGMTIDGVAFTSAGISQNASVALWKQTYEILRKRYPVQKPNDSAAKQSKAEPAVEVAPMPEAKDDGPLYQGKPARYWLDLYQDADPKVRKQALGALGNIAGKDKRFIPALVAGLHDKDEANRRASLAALGTIGANAKPALPVIVESLGAYLQTTLDPEIAERQRATIVSLRQRANSERPNAIVRGALDEMPVSGYVGKDPTGPYFLGMRAALIKIDPELNAILPTSVDRFDGKGFGSPKTKKGAADAPEEDAKEVSEWTKWQEAFGVLTKKYPLSRLGSSPPAVPEEWAFGEALVKEAAKNRGMLYQGKPGDFWKSQWQDADPKLRSEAVEALGGLAERYPELLPLLAKTLKDGTASVETRAAKALIAVGPDALPFFVEALKDKSSPHTVSLAAEAIGLLGPAAKSAAPELAKALSSDDAKLRGVALVSLLRLGADAWPALPAINELLGGELDRIRAKYKDRPEYLTNPGIRWTDLTYRQYMPQLLVETMQFIDPGVNDALPTELYIEGGIWNNSASNKNLEVLLTLWQRAYSSLKIRFATSVPNPASGQLPAKDDGPLFRNKPARVWLMQFQDGAPSFRAEAIAALGALARLDQKMLPAVVAGLRDKDVAVRRAAVNALGQVGPNAKPALPVLTEALGATIESIATTPGFGLKAKGFQPQPKGKGIAGFGKSKTDVERSLLDEFAIAFAKIEPGTASVFPDKNLPADEPREPLWRKAHESLRAKYLLPKPNEPAAKVSEEWHAGEALLKEASQERGKRYQGQAAAYWSNQLKDADVTLRKEAAFALGTLAERNPGVLADLAAALRDRDQSVVSTAASGLASRGAEGMPLILEAFQDKKSPYAFRYAATAVSRIGPSAKAALPFLIEGLKTSDSDIRAACMSGLMAIKEEAKSAMPALVEIMGDYLEQEKFQPKEKEREEFVWLVNILVTMQKIDPTIMEALPSEFSKGAGVRLPAAPVQSWNQRMDLWRRAHEGLKKKYAVAN